MRQIMRWFAALTSILALVAFSQTGMLASLDNSLGDWRLEASNRSPSGDTIVIEIDSKSLEAIGVWPWPRTIYASMLDKLMDVGVDEVVFDIDFSSASPGFSDAIFTDALHRAGGYAWLAAFVQQDANGVARFSRPLPAFAEAAGVVLVNVLLDPFSGRAQGIPSLAEDDKGVVPALAWTLGQSARALPKVLTIDFGIDASAIPRMSFTDVLYGRVDPTSLAGKQAIIGASAIELRDFFNVPRYGIISGPMVQALALETVKADRILFSFGFYPGLIIVCALALVLLVRKRSPPLGKMAAILAVFSLMGELGALFAYAQANMIVQTASLHTGLVLLFGLALADNGYKHFLAQRTAQQRLHYLATHDLATGAWSRQGLLDLPDHADELILILLHLNNLDELRATLGHDVCEGLVVQFSERLAQTGFNEVARTGPDNFALLAPADGHSDSLATIVGLLCIKFSGAYSVDEHSVHVEVTSGYAAGSTSRALLLSQAEIALIQGKATKSAARFFQQSDQQKLDRHVQLVRDLRQAIRRRQLQLVFQPQVDLETRQMIGAEALLRWSHPELGQISPAEFIPLAEETGYILELGEWVLSQACQQACFWPRPINVAVNVSPVQFQRGDLFETVRAALLRSGLPPSRLELEITEGQAVSDLARVRDVLKRLQALQIKMSIDDFGTGFSSLSHLRDLPFETLKIDQSFVRDRTSPADQALLAAIVSLATRMGKLTIAEGIEDEATALRLASLGCSFGQGYHFSRPISGSDLIALMLARERLKSG